MAVDHPKCLILDPIFFQIISDLKKRLFAAADAAGYGFQSAAHQQQLAGGSAPLAELGAEHAVSAAAGGCCSETWGGAARPGAGAQLWPLRAAGASWMKGRAGFNARGFDKIGGIQAEHETVAYLGIQTIFKPSPEFGCSDKTGQSRYRICIFLRCRCPFSNRILSQSGSSEPPPISTKSLPQLSGVRPWSRPWSLSAAWSIPIDARITSGKPKIRCFLANSQH